MTRVAVGYVLVAAAIVAALAAFSSADGYVGRMGIVWNMQNAGLLTAVVPGDPSALLRDCSKVAAGNDFSAAFDRNLCETQKARAAAPHQVHRMSLGVALILCAAAALLGLAFVVLPRQRVTAPS